MLDDKIRDACHRIEELYYETNGKCYVSFSGGKDSTVLLALIKLCEEVYTIPPNVVLPFDEAYERERENGGCGTNQCDRKCCESTDRPANS